MRSGAVTLILVLACVLSGPGRANGEQFSWKTATLAPDGIGWAKHMKDIIFPEMEKSTKGDLKVKVYWGGVMGDEEDYLAKMRIGQLQGAGLSAQGAVMACPDLAVMELPFLFRNYYEVDYLRVKMDRTFINIMEEKGLFLIGWIDQDFDQIYSTDKPIRTVEDFKGSRFVTWYGPMEEIMLKRLDADVIPVNVPELATTIRQGIADYSIGPAVWVVGAQLYSKVKYVNPVKIRYSPAIIILTQEAWSQLPEEYSREFYQKRLELGWKYCNLVRKDNKKFLEAMVSYGVEEIKMDPEALKALEDKTKQIYTTVEGKLFSDDILEETMGHLNDYRAGKRLNLEDLKGMASMNDDVPLSPEFLQHMKTTLTKSLKEFNAGENKLVDLSDGN
ncbi:TRAP-type C4-dicarboxylate transport system, substrate-binding protein [Desulfatibacillum alkenivorans DSM 16219]|jgi:TRAP-type C4-dicarboxylate transport system substrate-binding protein|uniref:TRAP-type C4-dicarboxylate transport system, substrate-binding protein n=1 Tax=Desulfatibacillum alkenivorans DSM 16219 TaxID=1121393 RepID=A0A1M6HCC4_9BACT|nr:TRAP transporter substrate-binding protein DctP [Desulfatibacillum alkenivorans]SHJ19831.1 TRAP-type C4-dicarboxylate transport system, substrate-binding protein [Desulfatibacillum alkenivorans DSM 16219]